MGIGGSSESIRMMRLFALFCAPLLRAAFPLFRACSNGNVNTARVLLKINTADINQTGGASLLYVICEKGRPNALPEEVGQPFFPEEVLNSPAMVAAPGFGSVPDRSVEEFAGIRDEVALHRTLVANMFEIMTTGQPMTTERAEERRGLQDKAVPEVQEHGECGDGHSEMKEEPTKVNEGTSASSGYE